MDGKWWANRCCYSVSLAATAGISSVIPNFGALGYGAINLFFFAVISQMFVIAGLAIKVEDIRRRLDD